MVGCPAVPVPPVRVAPAQVKLVNVLARGMLFPPAPCVIAVTVTTAAALVAVTPAVFPLRTIAAARLVAVMVVVPPIRKLVPVFSVVLAVRMIVRVAPLAMVTVCALVGLPVKVPVRLANTPATSAAPDAAVGERSEE